MKETIFSVALWSFFALSSLTMISLPIVVLSLGEKSQCFTDLEIWVYIQLFSQIIFYLSVFPFCLDFHYFWFSENKIKIPVIVFRISNIVSLAFSILSLGWGIFGIILTKSCINSNDLVFASALLDIILHFPFSLVLFNVTIIDICCNE